MFGSLRRMARARRVMLVLLALLVVAPFAFAQGNRTLYLPLLQIPRPLPVVIPMPFDPNKTQKGVASVYFDLNSAGACLYGPAPQDPLIGAMNLDEFAKSLLCGGYVQVTGPKGIVTVRIVDICRYCGRGHVLLAPGALAQIVDLDQAEEEIPITWRLASPAMKGSFFYYLHPDISERWAEVQIRNHRNPIARVEFINAAGNFQALEREEYNYFAAPSGMGLGPYTLRVTDIYGNSITDRGIALNTGVNIPSSAQFPIVP